MPVSFSLGVGSNEILVRYTRYHYRGHVHCLWPVYYGRPTHLDSLVCLVWTLCNCWIAISYVIMLVLIFIMRSRTMYYKMPPDVRCKASVERYPTSPVDFSVFAPRRIARGESFVLNLWVHMREQMTAVMELAQLLQPSEAVGLAPAFLLIWVQRSYSGLQLPTLDVHDELDKIKWTGQPSNASFRVWVPPDTKNKIHNGHFDVYTGGIRIVRVLFDVVLSSEEASTSQRRLQSQLERLRTAFASYSSADRVDVLVESRE